MTETRRLCKFLLGACAAILILSVFLGYIFYRDLKKEFLSALSGRLSSYAGQTVSVDDFSFDPLSGIGLHGITVGNPQGFGPGRLLFLKRLSVLVDPGELFHGRIHLLRVLIESPQFAPARNRAGKLNISDKLLSSFSGKSGVRYEIDELKIRSGVFTYNSDPAFRNEDIEVVVRNLSSTPGGKSSVRGSTTYSGSRIDFEGWAYLKDDPKRFRIAVSSTDFSSPLFGLVTGARRFISSGPPIDLRLEAEGNLQEGFTIHSDISMKKAVLPLLRKKRSDLTLTTRAFYSPPADSLLIEEAALSAGSTTAASLKGTVRALRTDPAYEADVRIGRLDLSAFNLLDGFRASGIASSEKLHLKGRLHGGLPHIYGEATLREGSLVTDRLDLQEIKADLSFSSGKMLSGRAAISGVIRKTGGYSLSPAPRIDLSLKAEGTRRLLTVSSSAELSHLGLRTGGKRPVSVGGASVSTSGKITGKDYSGRISFGAKDLLLAGSQLGEVKGAFDVSYVPGLITLKNAMVESEKIALGASAVKVSLPSKSRETVLDAKKISVALSESQAGARDLDLQAAFDLSGPRLSGNATFGAGRVFFRGIESGKVHGQGRLDPEGVYLSISSASFFNGAVSFLAEGKGLPDLFPVRVELTAGNLDASLLSEAISGFTRLPYRLSGTIAHSSFNGIASSAKSLVGSALIETGNLSVRKKQGTRNIIEGLSVNAAATFKERDLDILAEVKAGKISLKASGTVGNFFEKERTVSFHAALPEMQAADLREVFWNVFPDSLLYAGLQGSLSSDLSLTYKDSHMLAEGGITIKDFTFTEENNRYSFGPVNGVVPVRYEIPAESKPLPTIPVFDASGFDKLKKYYSGKSEEAGSSRVSIGTLRYGFDVLEGLELFMRQGGNTLNVERFDANIFGGTLRGSAVLDLSARISYEAGFILEGMSLTKLCSNIEPIRGYLSGMVDGVGMLRGSGGSLDRVVGKADFWTYSSGSEKTVISKEFLRKMGGPSLGSYLRDRRFDKGVMSLYLQNGFIIFRDLEISHKNFFGMTDLSVKVAPYNNRISVDDLLWSISEAAQRAEKK